MRFIVIPFKLENQATLWYTDGSSQPVTRSHLIKYRIREFESESKFTQALHLDALYQVIPLPAIQQALQDTGRSTQRERKLNLVLTLCVIIALHLFPQCSVSRVLMKLAQAVRLLWAEGEYALAGASALSYRRDQVGVAPMALLCRRLLRPLATPATPGAFAFGMRLVALDGTVDAVPDTPENARRFGRANGKHGVSAFPQVRGVHLVECGTHAILDATFWPYRKHEQGGARLLMRLVQPGWLVMWDGRLHNFDLFQAVQSRGSDVLTILPASAKPEFIQTLKDGTTLACLRPTEHHRRKRGEQLLIRILEYRITDPARSGYGRVLRLATTLLDPVHYPALDVIAAYHGRWEFEVALDEIKTHQSLAEAPLRGLTPARVTQELYGLVLAHYAVRSLMHEAAVQAGLAPTALSFVEGIELVRQAILEFQLVCPADHPALRARLLRNLARARLPPRRLRAAPRVVKRRQSKFPRKRPRDKSVPQPQKPFRDCVELLI